MREKKKEAIEDCPKFYISQLKDALGKVKVVENRISVSFNMAYAFNGEDIKESFDLTTTPCHFGGVRWWFTCPGCERRIAILYRAFYARYFRCRHCHGLTYAQRQMHRNRFEILWRDTLIRYRLIKILKGVGRKGFSKLEADQLKKVNKRQEKLYGLLAGINKRNL